MPAGAGVGKCVGEGEVGLDVEDRGSLYQVMSANGDFMALQFDQFDAGNTNRVWTVWTAGCE